MLKIIGFRIDFPLIFKDFAKCENFTLNTSFKLIELAPELQNLGSQNRIFGISFQIVLESPGPLLPSGWFESIGYLLHRTTLFLSRGS